MRIKKMIAGFLAAVMFQSGAMVVSAEENTSASFVYDDFSVNYEIKNSYGDTDVVDVTLTNTGEETIEDWMLYFDPNGEIQYVTNASKMTADNGSMYFKSKEYNADIVPNSTVTFTYAVNNCTEIPDYYALCQSRIEKTAGYDVSINVNETWGNSFNGSIVINNNTNEPIEAWELTVDTNFTITEITNSWAATVTELDNYQYKLKGTYTSTIDANSSVSLGFIGVKSSEPEISFYSLTEIKADTNKMMKPTGETDGNIKLSASTKELLTTDDDLVYFYAKPNYDNVSIITLIDATSNKVLATMYDDGDFENHGDDLENDGTFSCKINVDNSIETELSFMAEDGEISSNMSLITIYKALTDEEIAEMVAVNHEIQNLFDDENYNNSSLEDKIDAANMLLLNLSEMGTIEFPYSLIEPSSITYDSEYYQYSFMYTCGIEGDLKIEDFNKGTVGITAENNVDIMNVNAIDEKNKSSEDDYYFGSAKIIYDLDVYNNNTFDDFSYSKFKKYTEDWTSKGIYTTITNDHADGSEVETIDELMNLSGYDYIVIAAHGGCWSGGNIVIGTNVPVNKFNTAKYQADISSKRIKANGDHFVVTYRFFDYYYDNDDFDDALMYFYSCQIFGDDNTLNYNMYESLHKAGAETVVGYCNSLYSDYGHFMLNSFTNNMLDGYTAGEAMNIAEETYQEYNRGEIPIVAGNIDKRWSNSNIKNGDFESHDSIPKYWSYSGDVRILSKLGSYNHNSNNFLFMSTGIGSNNASENSKVSQVFHIPKEAKKLTLRYNVISEEPMEWIGDEYDDEFTANIYSGTNCTNVLRESTNTSTWYRTNITNFYGGDNTMYETKWKTVSIDVSQYSGKAIKLEFNMNNIGDDNYDSAVLIDNVKIA